MAPSRPQISRTTLKYKCKSAFDKSQEKEEGEKKVSLDWVEPLSSGTPLKSRIDPPFDH